MILPPFGKINRENYHKIHSPLLLINKKILGIFRVHAIHIRCHFLSVRPATPLPCRGTGQTGTGRKQFFIALQAGKSYTPPVQTSPFPLAFMPSISFLNHLGALLTLWLLLCCGAPAAENGRILMVTEATFPPYEFRDGNAILGIDPEIMREVARRTGRELVIEDMSFDSVITAVVSGKADVAASGITVTPERRRKVDFSIPYVEAALVIIVPKGSPIRKREDIRGKRIGVQHGATGDIYVTRNIQQPERFPNGALAVAAVAAGKVDAAVIDQDPATMYVAGNERLEILPEPLTSESYAIAVRKGDTALLQDINGTIAALKASGKLEEIRNAYAAMQVKSAAGPEQHASGGGWLENTSARGVILWKKMPR